MSSIGNKIVLSKNLRRLMAEHNVDRAQMCKDIGVAYTTFSDWYNGTKYPRIDKIEMMANYFGVPKSALIEEHDDRPSNIEPIRWGKPVPLVGDIACGTPILAEQNITDYVDTPEHVKADFALRCRGESMIDAGVHDGDIVFIRQQPEVDNGQIAAVLIDGAESEATLKRVYLDNGALTLQAANPSIAPKTFFGEDMSRVHILGRAVAYIHVFGDN